MSTPGWDSHRTIALYLVEFGKVWYNLRKKGDVWIVSKKRTILTISKTIEAERRSPYCCNGMGIFPSRWDQAEMISP
jgi:hypothetical protein